MESMLRRKMFVLAAVLVFFRCVPAQDTHPAFAVATVKAAPPDADPATGTWSIPNSGQFSTKHVSLVRLLMLAYGVEATQIANKPDWMNTQLYDVAARPEEGIKLSREELRPRLQALLQERFRLVAHTEMRPTRGYALVVAKGGPHMTPTKADHFPGYKINISQGEMRGINWSMPAFAANLTSATDFPVVDKTGITGSYDIAFSYATEKDADSNLPSLTDALRQATGLMLKPQMVPVQTVVIDSVDKTPAEN